MGAVATGLNACTLHSLDGSLVTGGYDKRKAMDCWVLYLSLMSLAAWRGEAQRGKGKKEERHGAKRELSRSPSCCHSTQKAAGGHVKITASMTAQGGQIKSYVDTEIHIKRHSSMTVSYLSKTVRLRGAERLIGHLQKLLWTLQGFGAGAQLTLRKDQLTVKWSASVNSHRLFVCIISWLCCQQKPWS